MGMGGKNKGAMKMNEYAVDKCFECDDFFTCDGQCDEVEGEPQTMVYPQVDGITPSVIQTEPSDWKDQMWNEAVEAEQTEPKCEECEHYGHKVKRCLLNKCKYTADTDCGWK